MRAAARRPAFWCALAAAVLFGVGTILQLTSSVEASHASGAITIQCGDALAPKTGPDVEVEAIGPEGRISVHPCDDPIRHQRVLAGLVGLATIAALVWLGLEISRAEDNEPATA